MGTVVAPTSGAELPPPIQDPLPVKLRIYNIGKNPKVHRVNELLRSMGTGIFHCAVELAGIEVSYGSARKGHSGVMYCKPASDLDHTHLEAIDMGYTKLSIRAIRELVADMERLWPGCDYDLLNNNCCHFCQAFLARLGLGPMPSWVMTSAGVGEMIAKLGVSDLISLLDDRSRTRTCKDQSDSGHMTKTGVTYVVSFGERFQVAI
eukprot:TRINITY_DN9137_c0_g1_i2.p1 TRINITY_DN9137_c0_g1~~TRINITY_DN9137_c0_g1_i2.p1  ORF type:complete len:219 (+),score=36.89 TRINITY_DN9137_c0_g1_i2:41-658(+)